MIPLMKSAFLEEFETKRALSEFILHAEKLSMHLKCVEFEEEFASWQGRKHAILVNSGGSANLVVLQAMKNLGYLHDKDMVGFSAVTWSTNAMPIIQLGLRAIPVDCEPATLNTMAKNLKNAMKEKDLKALFITNALGFTGDLNEIRILCRERGILLLEDNCESLGTTLPTGKAGNFGLASTFSFFVAHHMSTIEGGMICTDDDEFEEMCRIVRANGWDRNLSATQQAKWRNRFHIPSQFEAKYTFYDLAFNVRPTEITGFIGLFQLNFLDSNIKAREENFLRLEKVMLANPDFITLEHKHISCLSSFALPIICKTQELRNRYLHQFSGAGIEIRPMIAGNMQRQPFFKKYNQEESSLKGADFIHDCGFYCGNYPDLSEIDLETISSCLGSRSDIREF